MSERVQNNIMIEGARIGFRNFTGKEGKFNAAGDRNFCVFLEKDLASTLQEDGWNVKWLEPRDDQEDKQAYMQVRVSYSIKPPKIYMITHNGKSLLDEESVSMLDWAEIENVDLVINPYNWKVGAKEGVKAYVKSMWVVISEDEFEKKWSNAPDSADNSMCDDCAAVNGSCADCKRCYQE